MARRVVGDGNYLYNAISVSLVGNTEYWTILRILTATEFKNATYYVHHIRFFEAI